MRYPPFKYMALTAALLLAWNCSGDNESSPSASQSSVNVYGESWVLNAGKTYVIYPDQTVTDEDGITVAHFDATENPMIGNITGTDGIPLVENVDLGTLPFYTEANSPIYKIKDTAWLFQDKTGDYLIYKDGTVYDTTNTLVALTDMTTAPALTLYSVETQGPLTTADLTSLLQIKPGDKCTETIGGGSSQQGGSQQGGSQQGGSQQGGSTPVTSSNSQGGSTPVASSNSQGGSTVKSSASTAKSSSATAKSSASQGGTSSNYTIKYVSGGKSGSGWATRYWDCCKPHCAWPDKGGLKAHACDASGNKINDDGATSMCDGGNAGTCKSQIPQVVNDTLAFAFAAVPGSAGGQCGKCYDLAFTGKGKYSTDNHTKLKGKHLIVIASNIGYDVADGQFDIMIPGGGYGIFNGCSSKMGWGSQGAQYGGLLTECEESSGYKSGTYKSCLTEKCNASFSSDPKAKEGCLFLANWMNAAGNPLHNYKEVECPKALTDIF